MKKLHVLFMVILGLFHVPVGAMSSNEFVFKDGISLRQVEKEILEKEGYGVPIIISAKNITDFLGNDCGDAAYHNLDNLIVVSETMQKHTCNAARWAILHECGHAQMPFITPFIKVVGTATVLSIGYYWGAHKAKPYKNLVSKFGSKYLAAALAGAIVDSTLMRLEERRADNWANKHSDAKTLQGGIEYTEGHKQKMQNDWAKSNLSSVLPFSIGKHVLDLAHPSIDNRIAKIKKELDRRTDVQA